MQLACNVRPQAGLAAELVNLVHDGYAVGRPHPAPGQNVVLREFAALVSPATAEALGRAREPGAQLVELSTALRPVFTAADLREAAGLLNKLLRRYRAMPYLVEDIGQPFHLHFHGDVASAVESLGGEFATALALVVDTYGEKRFGVCEAAQCDQVYVDLTRNGSRRYCGEACTARAKMAAYRQRKADSK